MTKTKDVTVTADMTAERTAGKSDMMDQLRSARRAGVPLVAIVSLDPAATIAAIMQFFSGEREIPLLKWDFARGLQGVNSQGAKAAATVMGEVEASAFINPTEMLNPLPGKLIKQSMLFMLNAQRFLVPENASVIQAAWNCRDPFKSDKRMLVLIGPYMELPPELAQDVVIIDEALPTPDELRGIVKKLIDTSVKGGMPQPDDSVIEKSVDALRGLPAFPAEQVTAMSFTQDKNKSGAEGIYLDVDKLWERKRQMIEATPGLSVWRGKEKFSDIGGLHNIKQFMMKVLHGKRPPKVICFLDEIEKELGGAIGVGDSSGVSQAMLGMLLRYMEDNAAAGMIFVGVPGSGKSMISKAAGAEIGIPTISFNLSNMKGSFVGDSERNLTRALKVVTAVGGDAPLFVATCNSIAILPPELRRRYNLGIFFYDICDLEERRVIWDIYIQKYGLDPKQHRPKDENWTAAEIKQCVDVAWRLDSSLVEAAKFVVPVAVSAKESIERLRKIAHERFISASKPGFYTYSGVGSVDDLPVEPSRMIGGDVN